VTQSAERQSQGSGWANLFADPRLLLAILVASLVVGTLSRTLFDWDAPLWFDEAFTAAIASTGSVDAFYRDALSEAGGPVYYGFAWLWVKLFGAENVALRIPSWLFSMGAIAWILLRGHEDRRIRMWWAAYVALWIPIFYYATEARAYALLFLLCSIQLPFYVRMMAAPTTRSALAWCAISAVMSLTHYHTLLLIGLQGLAYLWVHRLVAVKTWPAALAFVPAGAWMVLHLPLLLEFARPENSWYTLLQPNDLRWLPALLFGDHSAVKLLMLTGVGVGYGLYRTFIRNDPALFTRGEAYAVLASAVAVAFIFGQGFIKPMFTPRYLIPYMPGVLFGIAVWSARSSGRLKALPYGFLLLYLAITTWDMVQKARQPQCRKCSFSWQQTVPLFVSHGTQRVTYLWDNPVSNVLKPDLQSRVGGFFFERDRLPITTRAVVLAGKPPRDPNLVLAGLASGPRDGFIWVWIDFSRDTLALRYPPRFSPHTWDCRDVGEAPYHVLACARKAARAPAAPVPADGALGRTPAG
jgi:hypothetical protein